MSTRLTPSQEHIKIQDKPEDILKQLLGCVKDCQKRYGGKSELATEFDSCVAELCLSLEVIFLHGLRLKSLHTTEQKALKHVSGIVASRIAGSYDNLPSFWPFIRLHLTKHEQERYDGLDYIWTNKGRERAWIRATINEHSLERYIHIVLSNEKLLNEFYEDWAILRDGEKNSMLPNMAAGLGSILFAININRPEFNSGSVQRTNIIKSKSLEPVIEPPMIGRPKINKKNRKVARQYIAFDDEETFSSNISSSSSSTVSDVCVTDRSDSTDTKKATSPPRCEVKTSYISEQKIMGKKKETTQTKLLDEASLSRNEPSFKVTETLSPVNQVVNELTAVYVEYNGNFEHLNNSSTLELPTDISAVLENIEEINKEEMRKKEEKIEKLEQENAILREQVLKYVSAIQMLKMNDHELNKQFENLELDEIHDYKIEAKLFENKLIQVAAMHAELIDFNTVLQQKLLQKEAVIKKLSYELENRDSNVSNNTELALSSGVNIWIPSAFLKGTGSDVHHVYQIFLRIGDEEWNLYRRYAQFYGLHSDLKKLDPIVNTFDFPPKKSIGKTDSTIVEDRRKRLQQYLRRVFSHFHELSHCQNRYLLEQHLPFFKDSHSEKLENKNTTSEKLSGAQSTNYLGL